MPHSKAGPFRGDRFGIAPRYDDDGVASSARYAVPLDAAWSAFGEVGGWAAPDLKAGYWRSYLDGVVTLTSGDERLWLPG